MSKRRGNIMHWLRRHGHWILLILIIALAAFFRFYRLDHLPPGLHPDEAANGLDIFRILEKHDIRPLYNTNGPRESLFFFIQAIFVVLLGNTILALRVAPAIIGTLAVVVTFFWARSWFSNRIAILASFLMAVTPWAVTLSRDGFRASMTPLFVPLVLWLYTIAYRKRSGVWFWLAGFAMGVGMYTYLAFRLFPLALVGLLIYYAIWRRDVIKPFYRSIGISLIGFTIALIPLAAFAVKHPGDVGARAAGTSFLNKGLNQGHPLQTLLDTTVKTALMFNVHGDDNYRQNLGGQPQLNFFVGLMFITGFILCISKLGRAKYFALFATFGVMLLPELLTAEGIPHALRSIGAIPAVLVLAAIGISYWLDIWFSTFPINSAARATGLVMILIPLAATLYQGYNQYFVAWAQAPETYKAYSEDAVAIGNYLNSVPSKSPRLVLVDGYSDKTVYYLTHNHSEYTRIDPSDLDKLSADANPPQFVISEGFKDESLKKLKAKYPKAKLVSHHSSFNGIELFNVYEVQP